MYKALIIDDEPLACQVVAEYLAAWPELELVGSCHDGFEGLKAIQSKQPDLVFLDIQMPKINGFEMLELVDRAPAIIFTTAFDEYAIRAFDHHATDYLLKPFSQERFNKAVGKFLAAMQNRQGNENSLSGLLESASRSPQQQNRIVIRENHHIRIIPVEDILYIEAADDYAKIVTEKGQYLKNSTMAALEQKLPAGSFVRIHRSYIVNLREITQLHPYEKDSYTALLRNGRQLPVSKSGYPRLKSMLGL